MKKDSVVRKNLRLSQKKIDEARQILGASTETETIDRALDYVIFREEVLEGIDRIAGTGLVRDDTGLEGDG